MNGLSCRELVELVTAYVEGVLPADDRARFDHHIGTCSACVAYVDQMRATIRLTAESRHVEALDPALRDELLARFRDWKRDR
jgi:anti-sigma factor RsiW